MQKRVDNESIEGWGQWGGADGGGDWGGGGKQGFHTMKLSRQNSFRDSHS